MSDEFTLRPAPSEVVRRDWRLPLVAAGIWASALAGLYGSVASGLVTAASCAALVVAGRRWDRGFAAALTTVAFGGILGAGVTTAHVAARDHSGLAALTAAEARGEAELVLHTAPKPSTRRPDLVTATARLQSFTAEDVALEGHWQVLLVASGGEWREAAAGQRVIVPAVVREADPGRLTAAIVSARGPPEPAGNLSPPHQIAAHVRERLATAVEAVPQPEAGLIPALAVGDTSMMEPELAADFRSTGLVHLVVVSGYHLSLVVGVVLAVAVACRAGPRGRVPAGAVAIAAIVVVAGPQPSVLRAAVMAGMTLLALAAGRPRAATPALATAVLVVILADPDMAAQGGFALSVAACVGLVFLAFRWARPLEHRGWPQPVALAVTMPLATQAAVTPLLVGLGSGVSLVSVPVNVLAALVAAPVVVLSVGAAAAAAVWVPAGAWAAQAAAVPARWLVWLARTGSEVPGALVPVPGGLWWGLGSAAALALLIVLLHLRRLRLPLLAVLAAAGLGMIPACVMTGGPPSGWVVTMCDVGQGDALVLPAGEDVVVVDVGPDPAAVDACLDALGVDRIALLVLSHFHIDHTAGIGGAMEGREVAAILAPPPGEARYGYELVEERAGEVPVLEAEPGAVFAFGATRLEVLGPPAELLSGTRSDPNNNSVALRAEVAGTSVLLTGDVELEGQRALLGSGSALQADVLKVPHHGSSFQVREFLEAADPAVALVGVGKGNEYGHPDPGPLAVLEGVGALVFRTDEAGRITVSRNGSDFEVRTEE
ncbi:ComEC/Rec2 family competence protein [Glycomyces sp. TRM65418]|uniref:ComEC/Rec2 family competence protein n=1 Tax=Glycomyces sp. TRM65418 TaxID=2867006 RepID=UPI001CE4CCBF|nr:ComEC/Rec2 family competence protein [Glycomyces sp. TRM65418]MCC3765821.1 ComEC/Rec2 family competence protein [Glycomyces sp. TRM65418]QZD55407.1 ComEC/Rec2 family competence protein [Glycomyces sp. TRM65418]